MDNDQPRKRRRFDAVLSRSAWLEGFVTRTARHLRRLRFRGSTAYWEGRYSKGGTSGGGSSGSAAEYKAKVINSLVARYEIKSVIEFGCGDSVQLSLAAYPRYIGLDVASSAVRSCAERFADDATKSFFLYAPDSFYDRSGVLRADAALSLDVIYHLVEDAVFTSYMKHLFGAADRLVVIYSSDYSSDPEKRRLEPHVRHRRFTSWVEAQCPGWELTEKIPTPGQGEGSSAPSLDFFVYTRRQ